MQNSIKFDKIDVIHHALGYTVWLKKNNKNYKGSGASEGEAFEMALRDYDRA